MPDVSLYCLKCVITIRYGSCKITIKRKYDEFIIVYTYMYMYIYIYNIFIYVFIYKFLYATKKDASRDPREKKRTTQLSRAP